MGAPTEMKKIIQLNDLGVDDDFFFSKRDELSVFRNPKCSISTHRKNQLGKNNKSFKALKSIVMLILLIK